MSVPPFAVFKIWLHLRFMTLSLRILNRISRSVISSIEAIHGEDRAFAILMELSHLTKPCPFPEPYCRPDPSPEPYCLPSDEDEEPF